MALFAILTLLLAAPVLADQAGPAPAEQQEFIDPAALKARADALRDAVADNNVSDVSVHGRAQGFFDKLPQENLVVAVPYRRMEREAVTGKVGSIGGMLDEADRLAEWKRTHAEPPPPDLLGAMDTAKDLKDSKRLSYDTEGQLQENQMGIFKYVVGGTAPGVVKLNNEMKRLAILIGDAFTYATVAHESQHARDHAAGILTPDKEIEGEIHAFHTQYLLLKMIDPSGEKMLTLHGSLAIWLGHEPDPEIKVALSKAVKALEHLSEIVETNGKDDDLRKLVERLGYSEGHEHEGRGAGAPPSA